MSGHRNYSLAPEVPQQARRLGMFGMVEDRVKKMARHSAPFSHPAGNRRYEGYVLRIENGVVKSIARLDLSTGEAVSDVLGLLERRRKMEEAVR